MPLIWAVVWIIGFFTAEKVVDDLTTTTQEKEELMKTTQDTCAKLNLTKEQCAAMISQTQSEASSGTGIGDMIKMGLYVLLGYGVYKVATDK
jgi:hypothetical protein